jgi:cell division septum initiation protein DivIVA
MSYRPKLDHHYELWNKLTAKFDELGVNDEEVQEFLQDTIERYVREHKENVSRDIENALEVIAMYDKKRIKS